MPSLLITPELIIVMHQGKIILQGDRQAIRDSPEVRRVYLGTN